MFNGANNAIQNNTDPEQTAPLADQHVQIQRGGRESGHPPPPEKSQKYRVS